VIYCVVPGELEAELFEKLTAYYADDPNVSVIVERRKSSRRKPSGQDGGPAGPGKREVRDRRRARIPGELPQLARD
jgi:hypothetical protein